MHTHENKMEFLSNPNCRKLISISAPEMRDKVLQELLRTRRPGQTKTIEEFNSMKQSVLVLMNTRTKQLDLDLLMTFHPDNNYPYSTDEFYQDFLQTLKMVSIDAPNVGHLKIPQQSNSLQNSIGKILIGLLSSLKELIILEIVGHSTKVDYALLCAKLSNLQVLSVDLTNFDSKNMSEEQIRSSFQHLRLLEGDMSHKTRCMIWKVLPQLDIVSDVRKMGLTLEEFLEDDTFPRARKYFNHEEHNYSVCPTFPEFPMLRHLEIDYDKRISNNSQSLQVPTTLESLILYFWFLHGSVDAELLQYGANIRRLSLNSDGLSRIDLHLISELCPKLEVLLLRSVGVSENPSEQAIFLNLTEIVWDDIFCSVEGSLAAVLASAPNLQKLRLKCRYNKPDNLKVMKNLIIEKKILGSLQSLHWELCESTSEPVFKEIAAILKIVSATIPDLRDLKISILWNASKYVNMARSIHGSFITQALFGWSDDHLVEILNLYK
ncbi:Hypothetical predicted protein [Cloeon dipterum]|uniref:Uncharacterized protein n=1 Tax=Cloeon dipterum TaxID=197152 RepID=A0A8S1E4N5_9INSE|nr:Hypothetical predicted protein [Cloeon dipterum]